MRQAKRTLVSIFLLGASTLVGAQQADIQPPPSATLAEEQAKIDAALESLTQRRLFNISDPQNMARSVGRYGKILKSYPLGITGLTAWLVESNGRRITLYTPPDGRYIFAGVILDAGGGLVSGLPTQQVQPPATLQEGNSGPAALEGKYTGSIPEPIKNVDGLQGVKEGNGGIADTLYVIIDPRCPYCRQAYANTRDYVKRGKTIKWIPAVALGVPEEGVPLAASLLQSKTPTEALKRVMGGESVMTQPDEKTQKALLQNLDYLFAAFKHTPSVNNGMAAVPVGFYIDHRTGQPLMKTGISEQVILEEIFGKLKGAP